MTIRSDELGYIAWDDLNEDDCRYLIKNAKERLSVIRQTWLASYRADTSSPDPASAGQD